MRTYLAIAAIYRDDAAYLAEWIEFHRLVGAERFFLYDNLSTDEHRSVLDPYVREGVVVVHDWPQTFPSGQVPAFADCLERHRDDARWIAFLDVDEFLFAPGRQPVAELLVDFEQFPGLGVSRAEFGTSGHRKRPAGLVIENFLHRRAYDPGTEAFIKSIVDPARVESVGKTPHSFIYEGRQRAVDEHKRPIEPPFMYNEWTISLLRINHYKTKSEEELRRKLALWQTAGSPREEPNWERMNVRLNAVRDDAILPFVPPLREALARRPSALGAL